ncbi:hypothetical protein PUNSTDRAFT_140710 [Punctularia strigosozonata HHB-11173 SS5]|uniref:uncharacterized protein n=1 Tax=Punctularia strigosozonata (strain HHB-11173) TaxID=741275 RepID=UPI000441709C|nr:uncharacterized protein PUNSTDRAFT_140710 [Punctularia strigosozonata HHB-11173 SS5]EIN14411.1 hypothetical protein PUNSTDRAFT_140710 [Punctularia strigosozonata HHB-11173 SS5]
MNDAQNADPNDTPRSSLSPNQAPQWAPPRSPLPPHRLAKLANALGISTPLPYHHSPFSASSPNLASPFLPGSSPSGSDFHRSPTPSALSSTPWSASTVVGPTSKYLLHVIPPPDLPHATDDLTPPPPTASGYHPQFRRGVVVPLHQSLQLQLAAIAREYALPSTSGLVLYLVLSSPGAAFEGVPDDEPGPRVSEDMWKHVWIRALKAEREDFGPSRSATPMLGRASPGPLSPQPTGSNSQLRTLMSPRTIDLSHSFQFPPTPSPSTPSSASAASHLQRNLSSSTSARSRSPIPHSHRSDSDPIAPSLTRRPSSASSTNPDADLLGFDLPGLTSPSFVPVLAKVEFDIDKRKATWFDPWIRSRRLNHKKRKASAASSMPPSSLGSREQSIAEGEEGREERKPPLELEILRNQTSSPSSLFSLAKTADESQPNEYAPLEDEDGDGDEVDAGDADPTIVGPGAKDPLTDVFGTDEETWATMRAEEQADDDEGPDSRRTTIRRTVTQNESIVQLAISAGDLGSLPEPEEVVVVEDETEKEVEEVQHILRRMSKGPEGEPGTGSVEASPGRSRSPTGGTPKKRVPPPLKLEPTSLGSSGEAAVPLNALGSSHLPYLTGEQPDTPAVTEPVDNSSGEKALGKMTSPVERRGGAFYEDLDLGLEPSVEAEDEEEWDSSDPDDHRRSQYIMRAQLDEIERTLNQLSPSTLQYDLPETGSPSLDRGSGLSPTSSLGNSLAVPSTTGSPALGNGRGSSHRMATARSASISGFSVKPTMSIAQEEEVPQWPAVPFSMARTPSPYSEASDRDISAPPSPPGPPRLAINGVSKEIPYSGRRSASGQISEETKRRQRELEEEQGIYPPLTPSVARSAESPVIPLSPDPFGRFSSTESGTTVANDEHASSRMTSRANSQLSMVDDDISEPRLPRASSRFSADSIDQNLQSASKAPKGSTPLVSVKGIKKLWRKSNKNSISSTADRPPRSPWPADSFQDQADAPPLPKSPQVTSATLLQHQNGSPAEQNGRDSGGGISTGHSPQPSISSRPGTSMSNGPRSSAPPPPAAADERRNTARKSILKTWKSAASSLAQQSREQGSDGGSDASGSQRGSMDASKRKRRPSMFEVANAVLNRGSNVSEIPPSPIVPEQFRAMQANGPSPLTQSPPRLVSVGGLATKERISCINISATIL